MLLAQLSLGLWGIADGWARGHNGFNSAAYQLAARNSLRWETLFPVQYHTGNTAPKPSQYYTHAPLGLHLHNVAAVAVFGDSEATIRGVATVMGLFAVLALFWCVRRFYGDAVAVLASAVYVALPINAIYLNMTNHASGYIAWQMLAFVAALTLVDGFKTSATRHAREWKLFGALLFAQLMTHAWSWCSYVSAFALATAWVGSMVRRAVFQAGGARPPRREVGFFVAYCAWVLMAFASHFVLVAWAQKGVGELERVFEARQAAANWSVRSHFELIPALMFSRTMLGLAAAWLLWQCTRLVRGTLELRGVIPLGFLLSGGVIYALFLQSAMIHSYWAWYLLPFFAVAAAELTLTLGAAVAAGAARLLTRLSAGPTVGWLGGRTAQTALAFVVALALLAPFAVHTAQLVPVGRRFGGSLWFAYPERGPIPRYLSGRRELAFARFVREMTARDVGVYVHGSFERLLPENRWFTTLDRAHERTEQLPPKPSKKKAKKKRLPGGWVAVGLATKALDRELAELSTRYTVLLVGPYFVVDYRRGPGARVYEMRSDPAGAAYRFFVNADEPPLRFEESPARTADWVARAARLRAPKPE